DVGVTGHAQRRLGKRAIDGEYLALRPAQAGYGHDGEEGRTVTLEAGVVLVARRLMDLGLAAELRLHRLHGQTVRLDSAVAAALAHRLVDEHAQGRIRQLAALAQPSLLRRASLVVDQRGHSGSLAQDALGLLESIPVPDVDMPRPADVPI